MFITAELQYKLTNYFDSVTGGTKSLPNTPKQQDEAKHAPQFWSTGGKEASDRPTRPSGMRKFTIVSSI